MIKWLKKKQVVDNTDVQTLQTLNRDEVAPDMPPAEEIVQENKIGIYTRIRNSLSKTRQHFAEGIGRMLLGRKTIDAALLEDLESMLISADLGIDTAQQIIEELSDSLARKQLHDGDAVFHALQQKMQSILNVRQQPFDIDAHSPCVILMVGVNGAGKTTTIGKLARLYQQQGKKVMLAAGDTFRAAAVQQLQVWGERNHIPVIAQQTGSDSASVIYDALQAAKARGIDVLIADTAGRLHTQNNLMEELKKVKRVMHKLDVNAPHEVLLVLDAGIGQNALNQAREFHQAVGVSGIVMTKLDGTAKGGILFAIANELDIPFRYIGIGEGIDDLRPFDANQFVRALFNDDQI